MQEKSSCISGHTEAQTCEAGINFPEGLILQIGATCLTEQSCMCLGHGTMPSGKTFDRDNSGGIEFDEFIQMTAEWPFAQQEC